MLVRKIKVLGLALLLSLSMGSLGSAEDDKKPDYTSMGGVAYTAGCQTIGLVLKSVNDTYRLLGYRNSLELQHFSTETLVLSPNCSANSPELGKGKWCAAGGSNAGFEIDFLDFSGNAELSPNRLSFYGQEPYCKFLVKPCICGGSE